MELTPTGNLAGLSRVFPEAGSGLEETEMVGAQVRVVVVSGVQREVAWEGQDLHIQTCRRAFQVEAKASKQEGDRATHKKAKCAIWPDGQLQNWPPVDHIRPSGLFCLAHPH